MVKLKVIEDDSTFWREVIEDGSSRPTKAKINKTHEKTFPFREVEEFPERIVDLL